MLAPALPAPPATPAPVRTRVPALVGDAWERVGT
jgi:hypothetical protein